MPGRADVKRGDAVGAEAGVGATEVEIRSHEKRGGHGEKNAQRDLRGDERALEAMPAIRGAAAALRDL